MDPNGPKYDVEVVIDLDGEDGNAFVILARVSDAMRLAGAPAEDIARFRTEAMAGDYENLLRVCRRWVVMST